ncbi:MAG: type I methionyl aminopeptidase [Deinococcota bacterium]
MTISSEHDLKSMVQVGNVVKEALAAMQAAIRPGISSRELDAICGDIFARHGAVSAPFITYGAPVNAFISVNASIVHGLPTDDPLQPGDVVSLDVTPCLDGYIADAARTVIVPPASDLARRLVSCAETAFWKSLKVVRAGKPLSGIGKVVSREVTKQGFSVVAGLAGHGVGKAIHEAPEVLNVYHPRYNRPLKDNWVLAIEPMVAAGREHIAPQPDGWTINTQDGSLSAHYENTVIVRCGRPHVLTA